MPHPQHEQVRQAYDHRCGYCGVDENSAGFEFTVDHYQPRAAGGTDDFDNLVYACQRCNQYKGDFWPTPEEAAAGRFILHPRRHDPSTHLHNNEITGELEALTPTGAVHIRLLHLNRPPLIAHRLARSAVEIMRQRVQILEAQVEQREQTIQFLLSYINLMNRLISVTQESEE